MDIGTNHVIPVRVPRPIREETEKPPSHLQQILGTLRPSKPVARVVPQTGKWYMTTTHNGDASHGFCQTCHEQFFPASHLILDPEARSIAESFAKNITQNRIHLSATIEDHGNQIYRKWKNFGAKKRHDALNHVTELIEKDSGFIVLPTSSRPKASTGSGCLSPASQHFITPVCPIKYVAFVDSWFMPRMNKEDLSTDPSWLAVSVQQAINANAFSLPSQHAETVRLLEAHDVLPALYNPNDAKFGELVPWSRDDAHTQKAVGFTRAHLILVAEDRCLACFAESKLHGLKRQEKFAIDISREGHNEWDARVHDTVERDPFETRSDPDVEKVVSLLQDCYDQAYDYLGLLQTDPRFMQYECKKIIQSPVIKRLPFGKQCGIALDEIFIAPLRYELYWNELVSQATDSAGMWKLSLGTTNPVCHALSNHMSSRLRDLMDLILATMICELRAMLPFKKAFEEHFDIKMTSGGQMRILKATSGVYRESSDNLFWALH
ncbi:Uu.00g125080.m01.CDS01 [Anthostomella pinea]|uniref:Uu.00g125080.m01.CDS01 n=1 Tax=Anthostomella pinea TaxID=933095 RepID=A0AAI8YHN2_9PEZI|nr:Uu.00g125080.m01.CDS01 [Anthostomella pinea]